MKLTKKDIIVAGTMLSIALIVIIVGKQLLKIFGMNDLKFTYNEQNHVQNWINFMTPLAKQVGMEKGLPWQALVVQTAVETSWGKSSLFQKYNNYGGIKATENQPYVLMQTTECNTSGCYPTNAKFRKWDTKLDGLYGYADFFIKNGRYALALQFPNDPYAFIDAIATAGYATAPGYATTLKNMITKYFG